MCLGIHMDRVRPHRCWEIKGAGYAICNLHFDVIPHQTSGAGRVGVGRERAVRWCRFGKLWGGSTTWPQMSWSFTTCLALEPVAADVAWPIPFLQKALAIIGPMCAPSVGIGIEQSTIDRLVDYRLENADYRLSTFEIFFQKSTIDYRLLNFDNRPSNPKVDFHVKQFLGSIIT